MFIYVVTLFRLIVPRVVCTFRIKFPHDDGDMTFRMTAYREDELLYNLLYQLPHIWDTTSSTKLIIVTL